MIVNKPMLEMSRFEFSDMMITLRAQYNVLRANAVKHGFGEDLSKFYMQIEDIFYRQYNCRHCKKEIEIIIKGGKA